jgi:hypothetical protein
MKTFTLQERLAVCRAIAGAMNGGPEEFDCEIGGRKVRILVMEPPKAEGWIETGPKSLTYVDEDGKCIGFMNLRK